MIKKVWATGYTLGTFNSIGPLSEIGTGAESLTLLEKLISTVIGIMTVCGGLYFIFIFIIAAFQWINAGGDKALLQKARNKIVQATVGLLVLVAAYAIVAVMGYVLGFSILQPASLLGEMWS